MNFERISFSDDKFLSQFTDLIYLMTNEGSQKSYRTVTNGIIGLGVILSGKAFIKSGNEWQEIPEFSIFGLGDKPYQIRLSNDYKEISIGFKPYYFNLFVNEKLSNFTKGEITDAQHVFDKNELEKLKENLLKSLSKVQISSLLSAFFRMQFLSKRENQRVLFATKMIYGDDVHRVDVIAEKLNITPTTLRNLFKEHIGVSPKALIKIDRTHKALSFQKEHVETLTHLCFELGYFDQAHFIKEFKSVMGMTPKKYFNNRKLAFDFYNYGRWLSDNFVADNTD